MQKTANYGLNMPEGSDAVDIDVLNQNTAFIDQKLKEVEKKASSIELNASNIKTADGGTVESHLAENKTQIQTAQDTANSALNKANENDKTLADTMKLGQNNLVINKVKSLNFNVDTRKIQLNYGSDGTLSNVQELDGTTVIKNTTLNYDASGNLSSVISSAGGNTVTLTLNYNVGQLSSITKAVS